MKIWIAIESCCTNCYGKSGKRALMYRYQPHQDHRYKENSGAHGKWTSGGDTFGWIENFETDLEVGQCALFELTPTGTVLDEKLLQYCDQCFDFQAHKKKGFREPNNCSLFLCNDGKCKFDKKIKKLIKPRKLVQVHDNYDYE